MSVAVVVAVSVNTEGQREVLGLKAGCTCQQGDRDEPNAWKTLWLNRPGDKEWTLANDLRPETISEPDEALKEFLAGPEASK